MYNKVLKLFYIFVQLFEVIFNKNHSNEKSHISTSWQ